MGLDGHYFVLVPMCQHDVCCETKLRFYNGGHASCFVVYDYTTVTDLESRSANIFMWFLVVVDLEIFAGIACIFIFVKFSIELLCIWQWVLRIAV